jgi:hypothetical protein
MTLPAQLQEQVAAAKEIAEQLYGPTAGGDTDPAPENGSQGTAGEGGNTDPAPDAGSSDSSAVAPRAEDPATRTPEENNDTYAQRWRSLQGVYNAQKRQLDETQQRLANMEQLVAQMQTAPEPRQPSKAPKHLSEKDVTEYGEDMVDFARRAAREEAAPLAQALQQMMNRLDQLQGVVPTVRQLANDRVETAHEKFYAALTREVSDWKSVNEHPRFHEWLLSADPLSGLQRQTLLTDAHNNLDVTRTVSIFKTWKRESGMSDAPAAAAAAATNKAANVSKLERQVAPGRASSGTTPPAQAQKKQWTRSEIADFFREKQAGRYKGREAEARALESDIFLAQREGRVALSAA